MEVVAVLDDVSAVVAMAEVATLMASLDDMLDEVEI